MEAIGADKFQYRKRYGLHAIGKDCPRREQGRLFQYRKRYGLHAIIMYNVKIAPTRGFNTASGMDCMQYSLTTSMPRPEVVSIPQAVWIACNFHRHRSRLQLLRFNTASGMDCMQSKRFPCSRNCFIVSIPQAVWIACNTVSFRGIFFVFAFQYRKRYGLHAIMESILTAFGYGGFNTASGMDCMQFETGLAV